MIYSRWISADPAMNTGKQPKNGKLPVGQQLANELADEDVIVKAPDKYVYLQDLILLDRGMNFLQVMS